MKNNYISKQKVFSRLVFLFFASGFGHFWPQIQILRHISALEPDCQVWNRESRPNNIKIMFLISFCLNWVMGSIAQCWWLGGASNTVVFTNWLFRQCSMPVIHSLTVQGWATAGYQRLFLIIPSGSLVSHRECLPDNTASNWTSCRCQSCWKQCVEFLRSRLCRIVFFKYHAMNKPYTVLIGKNPPRPPASAPPPTLTKTKKI